MFEFSGLRVDILVSDTCGADGPFPIVARKCRVIPCSSGGEDLPSFRLSYAHIH